MPIVVEVACTVSARGRVAQAATTAMRATRKRFIIVRSSQARGPMIERAGKASNIAVGRLQRALATAAHGNLHAPRSGPLIDITPAWHFLHESGVIPGGCR